ncbi:hypothetical protein NQ314_018304 [Rhamnusium bicolor]|uniref:DDE Tnp4 domain-containing protein n=1 Tax=Rhamnusium bicolor TaxID=1586634 RepID=A0AAV8WQJ2_9CUCU|nr:hypothetical protein NQ314_018304 [Rhamnusium bicolor]
MYQRIFNYRLSRARCIVENTFGILANRFRILLNVIPLKSNKAKVVTQVCVALHNFLRKESNLQYPEENIDKRFRFIYGLSRQTGNRPKNEVIQIREEFKEYANGCGSVPWQDNMI